MPYQAVGVDAEQGNLLERPPAAGKRTKNVWRLVTAALGVTCVALLIAVAVLGAKVSGSRSALTVSSVGAVSHDSMQTVTRWPSSTGVDNFNNAISPGAIDPHWFTGLYAEADYGEELAADVHNVHTCETQHPAWASAVGHSYFLCMQEPGEHTIATKFNAASLDSGKHSLTYVVAGKLTHVKLNGNNVAGCEEGGSLHPNKCFISADHGLVVGENLLEVSFGNDEEAPAIAVFMSKVVHGVTVEPASRVFSSGMKDDGKMLLNKGHDDAHWYDLTSGTRMLISQDQEMGGLQKLDKTQWIQPNPSNIADAGMNGSPTTFSIATYFKPTSNTMSVDLELKAKSKIKAVFCSGERIKSCDPNGIAEHTAECSFSIDQCGPGEQGTAVRELMVTYHHDPMGMGMPSIISISSDEVLYDVFDELWSTGKKADGFPVPAGENDPHWFVYESALEGTGKGTPAKVLGNQFNNAYSHPDSGAQWIGEPTNAQQDVEYYYATYFNSPNAECTYNVKFGADSRILNIWMNEKKIDFKAQAKDTLKPFLLKKQHGITEGRNLLKVHWSNKYDMEADSSTGGFIMDLLERSCPNQD